MVTHLEFYLHHFDNGLLFQLKQGLDEGIVIEGVMAFAKKGLMSFFICLK